MPNATSIQNKREVVKKDAPVWRFLICMLLTLEYRRQRGVVILIKVVWCFFSVWRCRISNNEKQTQGKFGVELRIGASSFTMKVQVTQQTTFPQKHSYSSHKWIFINISTQFFLVWQCQWCFLFHLLIRLAQEVSLLTFSLNFSSMICRFTLYDCD